jgi:competence protein ComEC
MDVDPQAVSVAREAVPPKLAGRQPWHAGGFLGAVRPYLAATFEREIDAGRGFLWMPVAFGAGVLAYFALPAEPWLPALVASALTMALFAWRARLRFAAFRALLVIAAVSAGLVTAKVRTDLVGAPMLTREVTATVTGWIATREEAARGGARILLRVHDIADAPGLQQPWPKTIRVTVRSKVNELAVGDAITMRARLQRPSGAVMPGGYDFFAVAYYQGIGAVGFAYGAAKPADIGPAPLDIRMAKPLAQLRDTIRRRIEAALPGDNGHVAAALVMGDQGGIAETTQDNMRASGLGHMLSISGLHMALVAGVAFWLIRALLALSTTLALNYPIKKWAAAGALVVATFYLGISGGGVATERSYIMLAVILVAVMLDRPAITLRNVALSALAVLILAPEAIATASFQMSFAATVALVAGYEAIAEWRDRHPRLETPRYGIVARARAWAGGLLLTSTIAGLATAPFAAFHFQRVAPLTLLANFAAMPVVGIIVMPMAFLAVALMPFGIEALPLTLLGYGLDWVNLVAARTAEWSAGYGGMRAMPLLAIALVTIGFLWLTLWRERWRLAGLVPIVLAIPIALATPRLDILVEEGGSTVAVRSADGRYAIINGKGESFVVETWLRADGDARKAEAPDLADGVACDALGCVASLGAGLGNVAVAARPGAFPEDCTMSIVVISPFSAPRSCRDTAALVIDRGDLAIGGAQAIYASAGDADSGPTFRLVTAYPPVHRPFMPPLPDDQ